MAIPVPPTLKFCSACGSDRIERRVPEGDNLPRFVCAACAAIHYQNPKIVVGCLPEWQDQVLLCRRAIEPRHGLWTLPAGFLENGETVVAGAVRETLEEASARVDVGELYTMISLPHISQVYMMFRARLVDLDFGPDPRASTCGCSAKTRSRGRRWPSARSAARFATTSRPQARYLPDARQRARAQGTAAGSRGRRMKSDCGVARAFK